MLTHVPTEKECALLTVGQWGSRWTRTRTMVAIGGSKAVA
jgi:hypothetical protein